MVNLFKIRIFCNLTTVIVFGCLVVVNYSLAEETATITPEPPPPPLVITINNPDSNPPAQSKTVTATVNRGTLSFSVMDDSSLVCNSSLAEFVPYEEVVFPDEAQIGQRVCFRATDGAGNYIYNVSSPVAGIDTTPATLTLRGEEEPTVYLGEAYNDAGAIAIDAVDGSLPIFSFGSVNPNVVGDYFITYSNVIDRAGNLASGLMRIVKVRSKPPPEAIIIPNTTVEPNIPTTTTIQPVTSIIYCLALTYSEWLPCENGVQFRDVATKSPDNCWLTSSQQSAKMRTCQTNYCANVFYANWGPCVNGLQTRAILSQVPIDCVVSAHQQLFTGKTCSVILGQKLAVKKYPDGSLLSNSKSIYLLVNGSKYRLKNLKELWTYRQTKTIKVTDEVLAQYPETNSLAVINKK